MRTKQQQLFKPIEGKLTYISSYLNKSYLELFNVCGFWCSFAHK